VVSLSCVVCVSFSLVFHGNGAGILADRTAGGLLLLVYDVAGRRQRSDTWPHTKLMDICMSVMWQRWLVYVESIVTSVINSSV